MDRSFNLNMKTKLAIFTSSVLLAACNAPPAQTQSVDDRAVTINTVVNEVQDALANVQTVLAQNQMPPLKEVKLSLQTVASTKAGGTLQFWIISFGDTWEKDKAQQLTITLIPPPAGTSHKVAAETLTKDLEDAIVSVARGVKGSNVGTVPLELSTLEVQLGFTVKSDMSGGLSPKIIPITPAFTGDLAKTAVQTLTISFATK